MSLPIFSGAHFGSLECRCLLVPERVLHSRLEDLAEGEDFLPPPRVGSLALMHCAQDPIEHREKVEQPVIQVVEGRVRGVIGLADQVWGEGAVVVPAEGVAAEDSARERTVAGLGVVRVQACAMV
jgi:hypothetical protein